MVYATNTPSADVDSDGCDADGAGRPAIATAAAGGGGSLSSRGAARVAKQEVRVCDSCYARAPAEMRIRVLVQSMAESVKRQHRDTTVRACRHSESMHD